LLTEVCKYLRPAVEYQEILLQQQSYVIPSRIVECHYSTSASKAK